ncbi:MAG: sugar phosphate isomerase/epimerase family protein [bacterium]
MQLSISTDYRIGTGSVEPYLRRITDVGFTHIHWCQEWCTDYLYSTGEIRDISAQLKECNLQMLDLHASTGNTANWGSSKENTRQSGVTLMKNRLDMTAELGGDAVIVHLPPGFFVEGKDKIIRESTYRSLDEIIPYAAKLNVRMALENMAKDYTDNIKLLLEKYGTDVLGICYDSGHGNISGDGLDRLENLKQHLIATHLHDNDGNTDQHRIPFTGTVDISIIAASPYNKPLTLEVTARQNEEDTAFLKTAYEAGTRLTKMAQNS